MAIFGNMAAAAHMPASDKVLKNSFASFAFENYETAAYKSLIEIAQLAGATDAAAALRQSCEEEQAMADWLDGRLDSVTRQYVSLLYRALLIWTQSGGAHDPGVRDRVC